MTLPTLNSTAVQGDRWTSPLAGHHFDTSIELRPLEARAVTELGILNLRRLQYHDPTAQLADDPAVAAVHRDGQSQTKFAADSS